MSHDLGYAGTRGAFGAKLRRPLYGVSSMLLKGGMRRKQASKRCCLAEGCHGDSQEACIAPRERRTLTYLACYVSQSGPKPHTPRGNRDRRIVQLGYADGDTSQPVYLVSALGSRRARQGQQ